MLENLKQRVNAKTLSVSLIRNLIETSNVFNEKIFLDDFLTLINFVSS